MAVEQWLRSKHAFHVMRDHPGHDMAMLAGMWGAKMTPASRPILRAVGLAMFKNRAAYRSDNFHGSQDQVLLNKYFWPWVRNLVMQHDSFHCDLFGKSHAFPSKRPDGVNNFLGAPVALNSSLTDICPPKCRPRQNPEWKYC